MRNHLKDQTSPYLLQHADNPVHWYPWCAEAFEKARMEDKPVFLSIGYSTCHWCHVMAHESFEDDHIAEILNQYFVSVKVDKEERPDIDSIYMAVCQAYTGSGGWPTTVFLTPDQKPFFAGTYFPKTARFGQIGLAQLLLAINEKWKTDRDELLKSADEMVSFLNQKDTMEGEVSDKLLTEAVELYKRMFDEKFGGFGDAPKFPTPHNLLFLMRYYEKRKDGNIGDSDSKVDNAKEMVEKTLLQMYRGGMFDHIGGGFCRYSTDKYFLAPHFEKMLYDNALLIMAYCKAHQLLKQNKTSAHPSERTQVAQREFLAVAKKTANYVLREMSSEEGGFYSAQDADSEGVEGKFYLFEPDEIIELLGEREGEAFNQQFDITQKGNFEGKNIPNLLKNETMNEALETSIQKVYDYRKNRFSLHLDDKILTAWNGLMIMAMCHLYRVSGDETYLTAAAKAQRFIEEKLCEKDTLYVSYRNEKRSKEGFLDDYAFEIMALLSLYDATLDKNYLEKAKTFCQKAVADFYDEEQSGFFLYGEENEKLITHPKETYDGAVFSGNSAMAYNLVQLYYLTGEKQFQELAERQLKFMSAQAERYPAGYAMFLMALSDYIEMPDKITIVWKDNQCPKDLPCRIPLNTVICVLESPTKEYPLKNDETTFYVCRGRAVSHR